MQIRLALYLYNEEDTRIFGEGPYRLLCGVRELGSLRAAAIQMGMAYTKATKIIHRAEEELGFPLTQRKIGGTKGGGSTLTPGAEELMKRYEACKEACHRAVEAIYDDCFSSFRPETFAPDGQPGAGEDHFTGSNAAKP